MSYNVMRHPSCLFVSRLKAIPDKLKFHLPLYPKQLFDLPVRKGRVFCFQRQANEQLSVFLQRLSTHLSSHFMKNKTNKPTNSSIHKSLNISDVKIVDFSSGSSSECFSPEMPLHTVFFDLSHFSRLQLLLTFQLDLCQDNFQETQYRIALNVERNPATIEACSLDLLPQVGCPFVASLKSNNLCIEKSKFLWMVSKSSARSGAVEWPSDPSSEGYVFVPKPEDVGHFLRLCVLPYDEAGRPGVPFGELDFSTLSTNSSQEIPFFGSYVTCKAPVTHAPMQSLQHLRFQQLARRTAKPNEFRIVSYNLLAFMYSTTESARTCFFRHCPPSYLAPNYRFPLIFRELLSYNADIFCLQEVDTKMFRSYLTPLLSLAGFDGVYLAKLLTDVESTGPISAENDPKQFCKKAEGVAIFFRKERLTLIDKIEVDSLVCNALVDDDLCTMTEQAFSAFTQNHVLRSRSQGLLACVFEFVPSAHQGTEDIVPRRFIAASTHLYFHSDAGGLRSVQCAMARKILLKFAEDQSTQTAGEQVPLPIILGGDLNCQPDSDSYQRLVKASEEFLPENSQSSSNFFTTFQPAITFAPGVFTNIVPGFKSCIDAVVFTNPSGRVKVIKEYPPPTEDAIYAAVKDSLAKDSSVIPPLCSDLKGGLTLPNSQFPSDHLPLIVDLEL